MNLDPSHLAERVDDCCAIFAVVGWGRSCADGVYVRIVEVVDVLEDGVEWGRVCECEFGFKLNRHGCRWCPVLRVGRSDAPYCYLENKGFRRDFPTGKGYLFNRL